MALVLTGTVVTFDPAMPRLDRGAVYVTDGGLIEAVRAAADPAPVGYEAAPRVVTRGNIYPGLIDLHNHIAYNFLSLWCPPRTAPYTRRDQWPREETYVTQIRAPANALGMAAGKALLKYAEVKALVGGVTAIQGSAKLSRPYEGWLIRNVEFETFGTGRKTVYQSVRTLGAQDFAEARQRMVGGAAFIYHLAEGTAPSLLDEFHDLRDNDCLLPRLIAIHATALHRPEYQEWGPHGGSIVWSPLSNLWLYRATGDVAAAREAGIRVCLGADWGPSGSKSVLGELKVADLWNRDQLDRIFSDRELCEMVTANPADALGWGERIGRIKPGLQADLVVTARRHADPYRNLIASVERDVRLVLVCGRPVYGTSAPMRAAGAREPEPIRLGGLRRQISMLDPNVPDADLSWRQVMTELGEARLDPEGAHQRAVARAPDAEPFRLIPDLPEDELPAGRAADDLRSVTIPPLDSLTHDARFFDALPRDRAPILDGLLDRLREYYRSQ
jgi:5-methylthioadenosine/S-adenosylhomocysteine deaminase